MREDDNTPPKYKGAKDQVNCWRSNWTWVPNPLNSWCGIELGSVEIKCIM